MAQDPHPRNGSSSGADGGAILLLAPQPFYEDRGTPIAVRQVLEALSDLGYPVDVVTYPVGSSIGIPGVRYFRAANPFRIRRVPIGFSARKLLLDAFLIPAAWNRLREGSYRAIHAVEEAAFPAIGLGRRFGVPVVYDMQSCLPEQLARHRLLGRRPVHDLLLAGERWLLRRVDFVITSTGLAAHVRHVAPDARVREWRFAGTAPTIHRDRVDLLRRSMAVPSGVPVVVYSGTFAPYQGLPDLVAAIPLVLRDVPEVVFVLVGAEGLDGARLTRLSDDLVRQGRVRVVARQPRERVPDYLAMADVLVSTRTYGGNLPLKIFDYLAAGKPIVATDVAAHRTVLDGTRAELVQPDAASLAAAIVGLIRDPGRAAGLAERARAYNASHLGQMAFVRSVGELYEEVGAQVRAAASRLDYGSASRRAADVARANG
jgi:glycosyltransferase involved in cell wall biosynthesis